MESKLAREPAVGHERILFVDDEKMLAEIGKAMLERFGYRVSLETSGIEALATFRRQPDAFDLVITDQTMPGMTGVEMIQRMRQIRPDLPIILCTGYSSLLTEEKVKSLGVGGLALKPLTKEVLISLIREALGYKNDRLGG